MPPPPRRWKLAETAPELPESTPRRSERGRRQWEAKKYFSGNHRTGEQDQAQEHTPVVAKRHDRKRFAAPNDHAAGSTSRKQKLAAANASEEEAAASRARNRKTVGQERRAGKELLSRAPQQQSSDEGLSRARKKKGVAASDKADAPAADYIQPKRRGRKARDDAASEQPEASKPSNSGGPRARPSENQVAEAQSQEPRPVGSKRKTLKPRRSEPKVEHDTDPESSEDDEELPYRYIQEIIRHVSRTIIADKWTPLDTPAIHVICAFLTDIQRSVLLRLQNTTQQRGHGSAALGAITRRLQSRLRKGYPFPAPTTTGSSRANAGSYEDDFDFERVVDAKQALENSLNPLLHSVGLLEREIVKEEAALARDYDQLHTLEANAKSVVSEWREKAKREHLLAPGIKKKGNQEVDARHCLEFVPSHGGRMSGGLFKVYRPMFPVRRTKFLFTDTDATCYTQDLEDEDLATLSQQIGSHMKSMKENLKQIEGILPAIVQSKAALQHVLLQHLDEEQYDNVLLG